MSLNVAQKMGERIVTPTVLRSRQRDLLQWVRGGHTLIVWSSRMESPKDDIIVVPRLLWNELVAGQNDKS